jgi:hypothetical protein
VVKSSTPGENPRWRRALLGATASLLGLTACGGAVAGSDTSPSPAPSKPPLQSVVVSAAADTCAPCVVKGKDRRLAIGIVNADGVPVGGGAAVKVQVFLLPAGGANPTALAPAMNAPYEGVMLQDKGVYVIHQTFDRAGLYNVVVQATKGSLSSTTTAAFQVIDSDPGVPVGTPAVRSENPTESQVSNIRQIDTNVPPDDMHYTTIASAIGAHHPLLIYFGSPGHCRSKTCAPQVDAVKSLEPSYRPRAVDFVHIETYQGGDPDNTDLTKATISQTFTEWKLTSDPWVIVVDKHGTVAAKFDGPTSPDEIEAALQPLL